MKENKKQIEIGMKIKVGGRIMRVASLREDGHFNMLHENGSLPKRDGDRIKSRKLLEHYLSLEK